MNEILSSSSHSTATALVVEDDHLVADFLSGTLEDMGFKVQTVGTMNQAMDVARIHGRFSVAFVDLGLPDRSGLELISELQSLHPDLPVIIASGYGAMAKRDMADTLGTDTANLAILPKPYDAKVVARVLDDLGIRQSKVN